MADDRTTEPSPRFTWHDRWVVSAGTFIGNWCALCGRRAALFVFKRKYVSMCPCCVTARLEALEERGVDLSWDLRQLLKETRHETRHQDRQREKEFTVEPLELYHCVRCDRLVPIKDARYPLAAQRSIGRVGLHCETCAGIVGRGEDAPATQTARSPGSGLTALLRAVAFSAEKHRGQRRKDEEGTPYVNHPVNVATLLADVGGVDDVEVLQAGVLHDTIEDTTVGFEDLEREFGTRVATLVEEVTDDKSRPKDERKRVQKERSERISMEARAIRIADKIDNLEDLGARPPADWPIDRKREYVDWTREVVLACGSVNPALEARYFRTFWRLRQTLGSTDEGPEPMKFEDDADTVHEIGRARGALSDGRPFHLECWAEGGLTMLALYLPVDGLEEERPPSFEELLEREGLLRFNGERRFVEARRWTDAAERKWWAVNIVAGDESGTYVDDFVPLRPYRKEQHAG